MNIDFEPYKVLTNVIAIKFERPLVSTLYHKYGIVVTSKLEEGETRLYIGENDVKDGDWIILHNTLTDGLRMTTLPDVYFRLFFALPIKEGE